MGYLIVRIGEAFFADRLPSFFYVIQDVLYYSGREIMIVLVICCCIKYLRSK